MFYSQFILAKKGPLGTIWIAAHLERKLRKNQVADTDIGVSVDSILFPEVPIALRLSSHLLLGVVRIYSRKVNYLFDDCSEALLKIKQAFRSTAVDLPPEESTAPYHSITLPETFDLDDFELPDNAVFHGNFVDHHISTRDQITLQDTMDGMVYSTSQFGLDERFGDGDASHIGLDFDEDLFLDKASLPGRASVPLDAEKDEDPQTSSQPVATISQMDVDDIETSKSMPELDAGAHRNQIDSNIEDPRSVDEFDYMHGGDIQTPDLNEELPHDPIDGPSEDPDGMDAEKSNITHVQSSELIESAHAPSTPGLREEAIPANVHGASASSFLRRTSLDNYDKGHLPDVPGSPHSESVDPDSAEPLSKEKLENEPSQGILQNLRLKQSDDGLCPSVIGDPISSDIAQFSSSPTSVITEEKLISPSTECSYKLLASPDEFPLECGQERKDISQNGALCNEVQSLPFVDQAHNGQVLAPVADPLNKTTISTCCSLETFNLRSPCNKHLDVGTAATVTVSCNANSVPPDFEIPSPVCPGENPCPQVHVLHACSSLPIQPNELPLENRLIAETSPDLLSREVVYPLEMLGREALDAGVVSTVAKGDDCRPAIVTVTNFELLQVPGTITISSEIESNIHRSDEQLARLPSNNFQLEAFNCPPSSDFPEPETLLLAPEGVCDIPNFIEVQSTADKDAVIEGEGSFVRSESPSWKKQSIVENTPPLQNDSSAKLSGLLPSKRRMDYIPNDDDILASILVGKRTPVAKMKSMPLPEVASSKRRRLTPRISASKRKVLLDDNMVLHGDVIRQQLTNTEDIRRIRRKAPCTRLDIWMIQRYLEDEIFSEPLFSGMSTELTGLCNRTYFLAETGVDVIGPKRSTLVVPKDRIDVEGIDKSVGVVLDKNDGKAQEATVKFPQIENQFWEPAVTPFHCDTQAEEQASTDMPVPAWLKNGQSQEVAATDSQDDGTIHGVETVIAVAPEDDCALSGDFQIESLSVYNNGGEATPLTKQGSGPSSDQKSVIQHFDELEEKGAETLYLSESMFVEKDASVADATGDNATNNMGVNYGTLALAGGASIAEVTEGGISVDVVPQKSSEECHDSAKEFPNEKLAPLPANCLIDAGTDVPGHIPDASVESGGPTATSIASDSLDVEENRGGLDIEGNRGSELDVAAEDGTNDVDNPDINIISMEDPQMASCSLQLNANMENVPTSGENLGCQEFIQQSDMDEEIPVADIAAVGDHDDLDYIFDDNDTEFLNVDDEADPVEEEDDNVPGAQGDQLLENSGWSSRTRAVAKYLKSLFDNEAGRGRKIVAVDNLLSGKTRKEASRMFFETLVLKTKDYIQVEQLNSFENINIQPRFKLMKSEF